MSEPIFYVLESANLNTRLYTLSLIGVNTTIETQGGSKTFAFGPYMVGTAINSDLTKHLHVQTLVNRMLYYVYSRN